MDRDRTRYDKEVAAQYRQWHSRFDIAYPAGSAVTPAAQWPIAHEPVAVVAAGEVAFDATVHSNDNAQGALKPQA